MSKNALYRADPAQMALEEMDHTARRIQIAPRQRVIPHCRSAGGFGSRCLALEKGIVGIGFTVEGALRAFDSQYMAGPRSAD